MLKSWRKDAQEMIKKFLFILSFLFLNTASAMTHVNDYEKLKNTTAFKTYIGGVGNGYSWANSYLKATGVKTMYCPPAKLSMMQGNYLSILDEGVKAEKVSEDSYLESILLLQLIKTFPCK